jgi:hypothetical protein
LDVARARQAGLQAHQEGAGAPAASYHRRILLSLPAGDPRVNIKPWAQACIALSLSLACAGAFAQRHVAVFGSLGTGAGVGVATPLTDTLNLRADFTVGSINRDFETDTVDYDGDFKLRNFGVYGDWKPFQGYFRTSLGLVYSRTRARLVGEPRGGTFTIGNATVSAAGESITATARMPRLRPYVGIGWGLADLSRPGFTWGIDVGAIIGRPSSDLQVTPGLANAAGAANVELERQELRREVRKIRAEPVLKASVGYVF